MHCTLSIVRYPKRYAYFGFLSMALFRVYLMRRRNISFYKLMGSGKNGTFDKTPDLQQWALLAVFTHPVSEPTSAQELYGKKIAGWWSRYGCEVLTIALQPIEGHGKWDGKECFGTLPKATEYEGAIAVLTRASIRLSKAASFWQQVEPAAAALNDAPGFVTSFGIGELPWLKQATFSVWSSKELMKQYAYKRQQHQQVIQKTRKEKWYSEEMFVRFKILWTDGTIRSRNPLEAVV